MERLLEEIDPETITENVFKLLNKDWMLITAGTLQRYNTMTASWGGLGVLWNKKICFCVIRPQRYTRQFVDQEEFFSLSFFTDQYRQMLEFCGSHSGRDCSKAAACGLSPFEFSPGVISFAEARLILGCRKIYFQDFDPTHFLDPAIAELYPQNDYHRMYIGELHQAWKRSDDE